MARNPARIHAFCFDGVETHAYAGGVEADFADEAGLGDHFDRGLGSVGLRDCEGDEVLALGAHPVPVLGEEAGVRGEPGESGAAVAWGFVELVLVGARCLAEEPEGDFCADVDGYDVGEGDGGAGGDS